MRSKRLVAAGGGATVLLSLLVGCGGQPAVCDDVDALRTSVENLQYATIGKNALDVVVTEVRNIEEGLGRLADDAAEQYAAEIGVVEADLDRLRSSSRDALSSPTEQALSGVGDDLRAVRTSVSRLVQAVEDTC